MRPVSHRPAGTGRPAGRKDRTAGLRSRTSAPSRYSRNGIGNNRLQYGILSQGRSSLFNPNTGPHTSSIQVYLVSPDKRNRTQVEIMNDVRPKIVKLFPRGLDVFRSRRSRQTCHELRLSKGRWMRKFMAMTSTKQETSSPMSRRSWSNSWTSGY